jgi:hypothetical protein
MAESPEEAYERVLAEEQAKGSSPPVAEARAKAARARVQKGLPADPKEAAAAEASTPAAATEPSEAGPTDSEETAAAPAAADAPAAAATAAAATATKAAPAPSTNGGGVPDRIQRLLAVVKPEAIQRVEKEPIDRVNVWPHLMAAEFVALLVITVFLMVFSVLVDAPFRELANINQTPNPSKAPWYFLGLQELLRYFHPAVAGVSIPQWILLAFIAAPYIDRNPETKPNKRKLAIVMMTIYMVFFAMLTLIGSIFRGPGFLWVYPWEIQLIRIFEF